MLGGSANAAIDDMEQADRAERPIAQIIQGCAGVHKGGDERNQQGLRAGTSEGNDRGAHPCDGWWLD